MPYTARNIHNIAISIIDEVSDNGLIEETSEYADRAPYLLDAWQKELAKSGSLHNIAEYINSDGATYKWIRQDLPSNFKFIRDILFVTDDGQLTEVEFRQFGHHEIYFYFKRNGTARLLYTPIPISITSLDQSLEIDDITATSGAYYLAEHYAIADQNTDLASLCRSKFKELKLEAYNPVPMTSGVIGDAYRVRWDG
jgi:hypothetical protein